MSGKTFKRAVDEIVCDLAGIGAIAVVYPDGENWGGESDFHEAHNLAIHLTGDAGETQAFWDWAQVRAKSMFLQPFRRLLLEAVKEELLTWQTLSYKQVGDAIMAATDEHSRRQRDTTAVPA